MLQIVCPACQFSLSVPPQTVGQAVPCTRCGSLVVVKVPVATKPVATMPPLPRATQVAAIRSPTSVALPPQAVASSSPVPPPAANDSTSEEQEIWEDAPNAGRSWFIVGVIITLIFGVSAGVVGAVAYLKWWSQYLAAEKFRLEEEAKQQNHGIVFHEITEVPWTDASLSSSRKFGISVKIDHVEYGPVHYQAQGEVGKTEQSYLIIALSIVNRSRSEITYQSWYSYKFEDETSGETIQADCFDDAGNHFELYPLPNAERIEQHGDSEEVLGQTDRTTDTLVFKVPPDYPIPLETDLKLRLPGAAVENQGSFQFQIPKRMLELK